MALTTRPAPSVTMPASPIVSTQASSTVATVAYEDTTFAPAKAQASATVCTSADLRCTHPTETSEQVSARLTSRATATDTDV